MKILIAGIGNIFHGDDGFGCEVIRALNHVQFPSDVSVTNFGTRSYDLAYALADGYDIKIIVAPILQNSVPGTVYLIEPDLERLSEAKTAEINPNSNPITLLQMARSIGNLHGKFFVVGCEPATLEDDNGEIALSEPVRNAVSEAVRLICMLITDSLSEPEIAVELVFDPSES